MAHKTTIAITYDEGLGRKRLALTSSGTTVCTLHFRFSTKFSHISLVVSHSALR